MNLSRFAPEASGTPEEPRPDAWPRWWWSRLELSPNTHRSFGHDPPLTRGWLHLAAALVWPVAVVLLLRHAQGTEGVAAALVFGVSMQVMFSISALTHYRRWGVWTTELLFRLDHTGIFLAVAGGITPFALMVLDGTLQTAVLVVVWLATAAGIVASLWPAGTPIGFGNTSFITLGLLVLPFLPVAWDRAGPGAVVLLLAGGAVYIGGAVLLAFQVPRLSPRVFGYHEVWHAMVVLGAALHYVMVRDYFLPLG